MLGNRIFSYKSRLYSTYVYEFEILPTVEPGVSGPDPSRHLSWKSRVPLVTVFCHAGEPDECVDSPWGSVTQLMIKKAGLRIRLNIDLNPASDGLTVTCVRACTSTRVCVFMCTQMHEGVVSDINIMSSTALHFTF